MLSSSARKLAVQLEIPAEVDLDPPDLVAVEGEHLGVAAPAPVRALQLVGDDDLVAGLDQADDVDPLPLPRAGPAALEEAPPIEVRIGRAREGQVFCEVLLEELAVSGGEGGVELSGELRAGGSHPGDPTRSWPNSSIRRPPRPRVRKLNAQRIRTRIRFWNPIRYQM